MKTIANIDNTLIAIQGDLGVRPGNQTILIGDTPLGRALACTLGVEGPKRTPEGWLLVAHDFGVDQRMMELIDTLTHIRLSAPRIVQLEMNIDNFLDPRD